MQQIRAAAGIGDSNHDATESMQEAPFGASLDVGETGLEPATSAMSKQCSNQLSYPPGHRGIIARPAGSGNGNGGAQGFPPKHALAHGAVRYK
jgi:hypothetical protein